MKPEMDDVLHDLRAELMAVEPSPRFAAGVRARIEAQGRPAFRLLPAFAFAAVAVVCVVGGAYLLQRGKAVAPAAAVPVPQVAAAPVAAGPTVIAAVPKRDAPRRVPPPTKSVGLQVIARAETGPFLDVITNQPEIIGRIWAGIEGGVARVGLPANEFGEITVAPVRVDAIVVPKIGPPGGGGIVPGARRIVVDESQRGDQR